MGKLLDYVEFGNDKQLNRLAKTLNLVLDHDAVWQEAQDYFDSTGNEEAEVRIDGSDYIIVEKADIEAVERRWLVAMKRLSMGDIMKMSELKQAWLQLENFDEYKGALVKESQEIAKIILDRHPEWSSEILKVGR